VAENLRSREEAVDAVEVETLVAEQVAELVGESHARRYRLTCWLRRVDRPVIILIGGATGTGKSTLAMELAFRLGIRLVNSTDMIREAMRTVLSPEVVPGLHDHSFRGIVQGGQVVSDPRARILAGFRQQVAQVAVGVRAVIGRAFREQAHLIVEGTHLLPPFEQYLPPGGQYYHAGLVLAVPEEELHLSRFPGRARRQKMRPSSIYTDSFQAVRWIHDDVLQVAEDAGAVVLDTRETPESAALAIEYLSQALPVNRQPGTRPVRPLPSSRSHSAVRTLFVILDGMADEPNAALDGKTPLAAADTPWLDMLAGCGGLGQIQTTHEEDRAPGTAEGLTALLGIEGEPPPGRGLLDAVGLGIPLPTGAVVFRGNLATLAADGSLSDRRAGRIAAGTEDLLAGLRNVRLPGGVRASAYPGHEHRLVLVLQGPGLSASVTDTDPGGKATVQRVVPARALDDSPEAARTVEALESFLRIAQRHLATLPHNQERVERGLLPANCIITRGAAEVPAMPRSPDDHAEVAMIAACPTALGVGRTHGMMAITGSSMTGNLETDLDAKFAAATDLLEELPMVVVHVKGTDIAAHDRRPLAKRDFIAKVDEALGKFLADERNLGTRIVLSADHGTSCQTGNHMADPVPVLLATWEGECDPSPFDEARAARGAIGSLRPGELAQLLSAGRAPHDDGNGG
jgi:2,3-bisphosphoglycerate-independent phosphoglycerate mutase